MRFDGALGRSGSADSFFNLNVSTTESLLWCHWDKSSLISHLNIIDYDQKKQHLESVPWHNLPRSTDDVLKYCKASIFSVYKLHILEALTVADEDKIPGLIVKLLKVCETYDIACDGEEAACLYEHLLLKIYYKNCNNHELLLTVWKVLCGKSSLARVTVFSSLVSRYRRPKSTKILRYVLESAKLTHFNFWGAWIPHQRLKLFPFCPVTSALVNGNVEQMTVLLQYGFEQNSQRIAVYDKYFLISMNQVYSWLKKPLEKKKHSRSAIITEVLLFLIIARGCRLLTKRSVLENCFQLLWSTIAIPFVTVTELKAEVKHRFKNPPTLGRVSFYPSTKDQFLRLCEIYEGLVEENVLQPRSLQHLCKCTIRRSMRIAWTLPSGIKSLPIPTYLHCYLDV